MADPSVLVLDLGHPGILVSRGQVDVNAADEDVFDGPLRSGTTPLEADGISHVLAVDAVVTATHMGGFLQWQSDLYPYGVKQASWRGGKGDLVADFAASCRKYGIRPGVYVSQRFNAYWQVEKLKVNFGKMCNSEL